MSETDSPAQSYWSTPLPEIEWVPIDPAFVPYMRVKVVINWVILLIIYNACLALWWPQPKIMIAGSVVLLGIFAYRWERVRRLYRAWGYAETDTDLYIKSGLLVRNQTVVPYGRMQTIELDSGPIERKFGLTSLTFVTAAASTDASISGLRQDVGEALRDRLAERGEEQQVAI